MTQRDILPTLAMLALTAAIVGSSFRGCYDRHNLQNKQQRIERAESQPEPTTHQVRFGTYVPRDANSNYDSKSR